MKIKLAALQSSFTGDRKKNVDRMLDLASQATKAGAQIILPSELFENIYFCTTQNDEFFSWATPISESETLKKFQEFAKRNSVVIPVSLFEKDGPHFYNSVAIIDSDGTNLGVYRKSHIPDGPGYSEKFYFKPGNTGFKVWKTKYANIGVGICWDQWFPECARSMVLQGADLLFYPTAIGSEPEAPDFDTKDLWQRAMLGHSVSNIVPVVVANRVGTEGKQTYYGHSFISDGFGNKVAELGRKEEGFIISELDLNQWKQSRASFGFFRDRRPELYQDLTT